jgi:hypothetical protein
MRGPEYVTESGTVTVTVWLWDAPAPGHSVRGVTLEFLAAQRAAKLSLEAGQATVAVVQEADLVFAEAADMVDVTRPHPARMYDYLSGGKDNRAADREAPAKIIAASPETRDMARANRAFLQRAVLYLARDAGITQFLDVGTGFPPSPNVHEIAAEHAADAKVVYIDNDPVVHAHANALLSGTGATRVSFADLRDRGKVIAETGELLDLAKPVALLLVAVLHFVPDADAPRGIVASLRDALAPASFLALSHCTTDFHDEEVIATAAAACDNAAAPLVLRPRDAADRAGALGRLGRLAAPEQLDATPFHALGALNIRADHG